MINQLEADLGKLATQNGELVTDVELQTVELEGVNAKIEARFNDIDDLTSQLDAAGQANQVLQDD